MRAEVTYRCSIHREPDAFLRVRTPWEDLERRAPPTEPFLTFRWQLAWWNAYGEGRSPFLVAAHAGDQLVALAPLYGERRAGVRELHLVGEGRLDHLGLLVDPGHMNALEELGLALGNDRSWDVCRLGSWSLGPEIRSHFTRGFRVHLAATRMYERCPIVRISGSWEEYLATFPSRFRKWVRKVERRSREYPELTIEHVGGEALTNAHVDELEQLDRHTRHWQSGTSHFADGRFGAMLRELLRSAGSGLELWCVRSSGRLVAAELAVAWQHRLLGLWTGFDASYPYVGTYAVILALQEAFQRKLEFFDFLQGDETYKLQWANDERTVDQSIHARLTPPGLAGYAATRARWRLAASPRVRELAARLRSSWNRSQRGDGSGSSFD